MDRACTTLGDAAAVFRSGETEIVADYPEQRGVRITTEFASLAVDVQADCHATSWFSRERGEENRLMLNWTNRSAFDPRGDQRTEFLLRAGFPDCGRHRLQWHSGEAIGASEIL